MSQQLGELRSTQLRQVTEISELHSLLTSSQSTLAETFSNRFALMQSLTDVRTDITEQISRLIDRMGENATMQFVGLKTAGLEELKIEFLKQVKEVSYLKEWKRAAIVSIEKLEEL